MKVAIGLSGGVDSAVSAYLLKKQGYEVLGITLQLKPGSQSESDIADAKAVAEALGIEHKVLDKRDYFKKNIIDSFVSEYLNARTPNPCIECNKLIKFGVMLDFALENGCEKIATGHYAAVENINGHSFLKKVNSPKDQSYFLYRLDERQISSILFPLGDMTKSDTRAIAEKAGIPVAAKKDSLEICFIPDDNYVNFLASLGVTSPEGNITDKYGKVLGRHNGIINYTIGQRKGIGAYGKPMFVTGLDCQSNTVTIGENGEQYSSALVADRPVFSSLIPNEPFRANVKIRFRAKEQPALIIPTAEGFRAEFDEPQRSITPGQSAVIYKDGIVLGGGRIISGK